MTSDMAHGQNTVQLTYEMLPDQVEAVMGVMTGLATSAEAPIQLVDVTPNQSKLPARSLDPETGRSKEEVRGLVAQYVLDRADEHNTLSAPHANRMIRLDLGLERIELTGAMYDLINKRIVTSRGHNKLSNQPEALIVYPHALREAVDSGFLILPPKEELPPEEATPPQPEPIAASRPADVISLSPAVPDPSEVPDYEPEHVRSEEQPSSPSRLVVQAQELEQHKDGRTEKHVLFSGDATSYSLTVEEVAALSDKAFLQLALTTKAFKRGFPTSGDLKDAISEATGLEGERREKTIVGLLREKLAVHSKAKGYRLKPTEEGEQYLEQQIASVKS